MQPGATCHDRCPRRGARPLSRDRPDRAVEDGACRPRATGSAADAQATGCARPVSYPRARGDLSEPFVDAARYLTERTGQSGQVSFRTASALELPFDDGRFDVVLLQHVAMNIADRARLYGEIRRVLTSGGRFATFDVVSKDGEPHYPLPWARTSATSFLLTAAATREAIEPAGFRMLVWQDDSEAAKAWIAQLRASGPPPSPNLGVVMGPDFAQLATNLGRNLMEGRLGILTAVFVAAPINP